MALASLAGCESSNNSLGSILGFGGSGDTGGSGGDSATTPPAGGAGGTGTPLPTGCAGVVEVEPNDTQDKAVPYLAGTRPVGCVDSATDVDFYEITAPAADPAGGYFGVGVEDVGEGHVQVDLFSARDSIMVLHEYSGVTGGTLQIYFAAAPGEKYRVAVSNWASFGKPYRYTVKVAYSKVADPFEPNDSRADARPLTVGTPVQAYLFTGYRSSAIKWEELLDFYKVELAAGMATVRFTDPPPDLRGEMNLMDGDGMVVPEGNKYTATAGANLTITKVVTAGTYYIEVHPWNGVPAPSGRGVAPPANFSHPYTLTVTQP
jgi:hypothetical protein